MNSKVTERIVLLLSKMEIRGLSHLMMSLPVKFLGALLSPVSTLQLSKQHHYCNCMFDIHKT